MATVVVLGSGIMATALATPLVENGHEVRLVGTHLDRDIIDSIQRTGVHPTLGLKVPASTTAFQLEDAAADLGATPWNRFKDITLPIAAPGILAGALMSFTISLDNTILSSFVQQPGYTPWPVYIFSAVKVALRPEVASISTLMFFLTLLALAFVGFVLRKAGGSSTEIIKTMAG